MSLAGLMLAAAVAAQDPPLNVGDPTVEAGMVPFRWTEASSRRAGFGYERRVTLHFYRVAQRHDRPQSGVAPYWTLRFEAVERSTSSSTISVWIDARTCPAVMDALLLVTQPMTFVPYGSQERDWNFPRIGPHAESWTISHYGTTDASEVRTTVTDTFGSALGPTLREAEALVTPCVEKWMPTAPRFATS